YTSESFARELGINPDDYVLVGFDLKKDIERILAAGHRVTINTVICSLNVGHLETLARALPLGAEEGMVDWHLSALICPEGNPAAADYLVRYSELVPAVMEATATAVERGLQTSSLLSSTHAAVPPCVLPEGSAEDRRWLVGEVRSGGSSPSAREEGGRNLSLPSDRMKSDDCGSCSENERCPGVPKAYGLRFGLDELRPLSRGAAPAARGLGK
ncbi:MAG: hypothetical protein ACOCVR_02110, partial [Myxococcota bacterium]